MTAVAYFMVIRKMNSTGRFYRKVILPVSGVSYGIYLMHMFFLIFFHQVVSGWGLSTPVHILVTAVLTFAVSSVISRLISMIPGGKYIVG